MDDAQYHVIALFSLGQGVADELEIRIAIMRLQHVRFLVDILHIVSKFLSGS